MRIIYLLLLQTGINITWCTGSHNYVLDKGKPFYPKVYVEGQQIKNLIPVYFCICPAPAIEGLCEFVSATDQSLSFSWTAAQSATTYRFVGHSKSESTDTNNITVDGLTAGTNYTFTAWAVSSQGLVSNNITCTGTTGNS